MEGGNKFPAQKQETQPGKEHLMDPIPDSINPNYRPANKLQVSLLQFPLFSSGKAIHSGTVNKCRGR